MHRLDDARLKIDRAKEHLTEIRAEIARYLDTRPYEFPTERDGDVCTARPAIIKQDPPSRLRMVIGDVLGSLRPIPDYIAWQLVSKHSPTPVAIGQDRIHFPIAKNGLPPSKSLKEFADIYAVPPPVIALIESVQPYHTGYEPLGILNALVNQDKHCFPVLTVAHIENSSIDVAVQGSPLGTCVLHPPGSAAIVTGHNVVTMSVRRLRLDDHSLHGRVRLQLQADELLTPLQSAQQMSPQPTSVKVDGDVSVFVSIEHPSVKLEPVERTLEGIVNCVEGIIQRFAP